MGNGNGNGNGNVDLDINNYSLEEILALYNLTPSFSRTQLRSVYRRVLSMHPDKNPSISVEQFRFFLHSYRLLAQLYQVRMRSTEDTHQRVSANASLEMTREKKKALDAVVSQKSKHEFNKWFNSTFEDTVDPIYKREQGYDEWIVEQRRGKDGLAQGKELMNLRRQQLRKERGEGSLAIVSTSATSASLLDSREREGSNTVDGVAAFFSGTTKRQHINTYRDLKEAHEHSIIDVDDRLDFKSKPSYEKYKTERGQLKTTAEDYKRTRAEFERREGVRREKDTERMYNLLREEETAKRANERMWGRILRLK